MIHKKRWIITLSQQYKCSSVQFNTILYLTQNMHSGIWLSFGFQRLHKLLHKHATRTYKINGRVDKEIDEIIDRYDY